MSAAVARIPTRGPFSLVELGTFGFGHNAMDAWDAWDAWDGVWRLAFVLDGAALEGRLDAARLAAMDPEEAMADLRRLPGIGPFSAALVVLRVTGLADVLVSQEPRALSAIGALYGELGPLPEG